MAYELSVGLFYTAVFKVITLAVVALILCRNVQGEDFFCENNQIIHIRNSMEGRIITRELGTIHYANNLHCIWIIEANKVSQADMALNIEVIQSEMEWAPGGAICVGYDYMKVHDGSTSDDPTLLTWCGERNPYSLTSTGHALYVEFYANDRNQSPRTGIEMEFKIFERKQTEGGCPPNWIDDTELPGGGLLCYKLSTHSETWTMAQTYCAYDQANLISVTAGKEETFISKMVSTALSQSETVWLSLNDIEVDGQYRWLNGDNLTYTRWTNPNHKSDSYYNCVTMDGKGYWQEAFCNENDINSLAKHRFICEKNKVGKTVIYKIPAGRHTKGGDNTTHQTKWITMIIIVGVIVVAVIVAVVLLCCWKRMRSRKPTASNHAPKYEVAESQPSGRLPLASSDGETAHEMRPTRPTAPPVERDQQRTVVVVVQHHPSEPPPPYEETAR